jgi:hypothetical protein
MSAPFNRGSCGVALAAITFGLAAPAYAEESSFSGYGETRAAAIVNAKTSANNFMISPRVLDRIEIDACSETGKPINKWECAVTAYYHLED